MLADSARRIGLAWSGELLAGYREDPVRLLEPIPSRGDHGLVLVRDLEFTSFCVHHLLPFSGVAHVVYLPERRLTGLSRLARMVDALARRLQIQEAMTADIVTAVDRALRPRGAGAVVEAEHLCMTARGVRRRGHQVVTTAWSGTLLRRERERRAVLQLLRRRD
jgi:GTP cyclohydrolase I